MENSNTEQEKKSLNYKELARAEYVKCATDPIYFLKKYVYIQTSSGRTLFNLYLFQEKLLFLLNKNERSIILKSRQLGITTLCAAYALWLMIFKKDQSILAVAPDRDKAMNILDKIQFAYDNVPKWLLEMSGAKHDENNKTKLSLQNGSKAEAVSGAAKSARGKTANVLILDEAAFIEDAVELWASAQQTLATGGKAIVLSTPNGFDDFFHPMYTSAESQENQFIPIKLPWHVHPLRDQKWRDTQDAELGKRMAAQECDCDFLTSGAGFFEVDDLEYIRNNFLMEPIETRGPQKDYWIWKYPDEVGNAIVVVDTAKGDGNDFSTIQVIDSDNGEQLAEYKGDADPKTLAKLAIQIAIDYNSALLIVENVGIGYTTIREVIDLGYPNIYYSPKHDTTDVSKYLSTQYDDYSGKSPGFTTSTKTRPNILNKIDEYVRSRSLKIRSIRLYSELTTFIWKNGKPQAMSGRHDDLIMPYAISLYLRDSALSYRLQNIETQRATLLNMRKTTYTANLNQNNGFKNPYKMDFNGQQEDISWVIR